MIAFESDTTWMLFTKIRDFEKSRLIARVLVIAPRVASHEITRISHEYFLIRDYNRLRREPASTVIFFDKYENHLKIIYLSSSSQQRSIIEFVSRFAEN